MAKLKYHQPVLLSALGILSLFVTLGSAAPLTTSGNSGDIAVSMVADRMPRHSSI